MTTGNQITNFEHARDRIGRDLPR